MSYSIFRHNIITTTCPHCKEGKATFSKLWWLDVDTYLTCNRCRARLAHVNFVTTALLYAAALALLYWVFQRWGANHSLAAAKRMTVFMAAVFFVLISGIRLGLVWLLWWLKNPSLTQQSDKELKDGEEPWWKPFVENEG
jgi:magnesium-transporting ATPase (P-type)